MCRYAHWYFRNKKTEIILYTAYMNIDSYIVPNTIVAGIL